MSGKRGCWWPGEPCPFPDKVFDDYTFVAHNVGFERNGWWWMEREFGWRPVPLAQWHCTQSRALQLALPASLENVLVALKLPFEKDKEGTRQVLRFSKPDRKTGMLPVMTPEDRARIQRYCLDGDVEQQWALHRRIGWLSDHERRIWELSQEINDRGLKLDLSFVAGAQRIVDEASKPLAEEFEALTGYRVGQRDKVLGWCAEQGVALADMRKETLAALLGVGEEDEDGEPDDDQRGHLAVPLGAEKEAEAEADDGADDEAGGEGHVSLPENVERALRIRQLIGSASIKKLKAMRECVGYDGRARGLTVYHGTTPGRQTAKLLQPHNFPRPDLDSVKALTAKGRDDTGPLVDLVRLGDWQMIEATYGPAVETIVSSLRFAIQAEGEFFSGDYSGIQLRTLLALAGQRDKCALVSEKDRGESDYNAYVDMAERIYRRPIDKEIDLKEYTIGKNGVLGLGFQGGGEMFQTKMAPKESLHFCEGVVTTYRKEWAPCVPLLWKGLTYAAVDTVWDGEEHEFNGIGYYLRDTALVAHFPNGSEICYQYPEKTRRELPWSTPEQPAFGRGFQYKVQKQGRWITRDAFGGQLTENAVMKIEREIMEAAKQRLRAEGFLQVLEVHDENIVEQPVGSRSLDEFQQIMESVDPWVRQMGIPIKVDCWQGPRYRK